MYHRNYKNLNKELFLQDLENSNLSANSDNPHENSLISHKHFLKLYKNMLC